MKRMSFFVIIIAVFCAMVGCKPGETYTPSVLVAGDSISLGYTPVVKSNLEGQFTVAHACGDGAEGHCNNGHAGIIRRTMVNYFAKGNYDVVTVNSGIHDMSILPKAIRMSGPCSSKPRVTPIGKYYEDMQAIFAYFKKYARVVIWVDTTTLPDNMCAAQSLQSYNDMAERAARDNGVYILHIVSKYHDAEGIHFTSEGYDFIGKQVSDCIVTAWTSETTDSCERTD